MGRWWGKLLQAWNYYYFVRFWEGTGYRHMKHHTTTQLQFMSHDEQIQHVSIIMAVTKVSVQWTKAISNERKQKSKESVILLEKEQYYTLLLHALWCHTNVWCHFSACDFGSFVLRYIEFD